MKFRVPRQLADDRTCRLMAAEIRKQKLGVTRPSPARLLELAKVSKAIEEEGCPKRFVCKKLPHKLGHGIFLALDAQPIPRHTLIAPYGGEVSVAQEYAIDGSGYAFSLIPAFRLTKEEQAYFDPTHRYHPRRLYSIKLDALKKGNFTRFINHSCHPNIEACGVRVPNGMPMEIFYVAKKTIYPGQQLLVCYEEEDGSYWGALGIKPFEMTPDTFSLLDM